MNQERYTRQTILKGFGFEGQQKLAKAKVLVVGAGGLGVPVLTYLNAMGVGEIGIVDWVGPEYFIVRFGDKKGSYSYDKNKWELVNS